MLVRVKYSPIPVSIVDLVGKTGIKQIIIHVINATKEKS